MFLRALDTKSLQSINLCLCACVCGESLNCALLSSLHFCILSYQFLWPISNSKVTALLASCNRKLSFHDIWVYTLYDCCNGHDHVHWAVHCILYLAVIICAFLILTKALVLVFSEINARCWFSKVFEFCIVIICKILPAYISAFDQIFKSYVRVWKVVINVFFSFPFWVLWGNWVFGLRG